MLIVCWCRKKKKGFICCVHKIMSDAEHAPLEEALRVGMHAVPEHILEDLLRVKGSDKEETTGVTPAREESSSTGSLH